jgi:DNA-binding CsgD family transcriptional regulator
MSNSPAEKRHKPRPEAEGVEAKLGDVVRALSQRPVRAAAEADADAAAEQVLLDVELDGVRCRFVRTPAKVSNVSSEVLLSPREQEVARMVARGYPNKVIADVLEISAWTVCTHLRRMFAKLNVGSRAALVAKVLESQLLLDGPAAPQPPRRGRSA